MSTCWIKVREDTQVKIWGEKKRRADINAITHHYIHWLVQSSKYKYTNMLNGSICVDRGYIQSSHRKVHVCHAPHACEFTAFGLYDVESSCSNFRTEGFRTYVLSVFLYSAGKTSVFNGPTSRSWIHYVNVCALTYLLYDSRYSAIFP